jgi:hypothetical protein
MFAFALAPYVLCDMTSSWTSRSEAAAPFTKSTMPVANFDKGLTAFDTTGGTVNVIVTVCAVGLLPPWFIFDINPIGVNRGVNRWCAIIAFFSLMLHPIINE